MRGNNEAGADPFLRASNLAADIMPDGYSHAHTNLKTGRRQHARAQRGNMQAARLPDISSRVPLLCDGGESGVTPAEKYHI